MTLSKDVLQFSLQAQHFGRVHRHFSWQEQHFRRVLLRVFAHRIGRASSSGDKVQIPWRAWHFVGCAEIDGSLAGNIDFDVANFQVLRKTRRKTSVLKLQSVQIGGSLERNARFAAPTCLVSRLWFPVASPCLWGKLQNLSFSNVSKQLLSCRFAWQA